MSTKMTYEDIFKVLLSEQIEEYVPDGISISHPVLDMRDGHLVDCFLLYSLSRDRTKYTVPTARIIIDSENKRLVEYESSEEVPFSSYDGTDYFVIDTNSCARDDMEDEYRQLYLDIRKIAFKETVSLEEKRIVVRYVRMLKSIEYEHLVPFLYELGAAFFRWAKGILASTV